MQMTWISLGTLTFYYVYTHLRLTGAVIWLPPDEHGEILPNPRRDYRYNVDGLLDLLLRNVQIQAVFRTVQACRTTRVKVDFADFRR